MLGSFRVEMIPEDPYSFKMVCTLRFLERRVNQSMRQNNSPYKQLIKGAVAGLVATVPMTIFMRSAWRMLPRREKYPLPPRLITRRLTKETGIDPKLDADQLTWLTLTLHFLFGAAAGSVYGVIEPRVPLDETVKGSLMGVAVWSGSYLGWIPAFHILPPATEHPWRRNVLMIVAHLVWGIALGLATRIMNARRSYIDLR